MYRKEVFRLGTSCLCGTNKKINRYENSNEILLWVMKLNN